MVHIPAFCNNCGAAFNSGIELDYCRNITISVGQVGPCPRCGSMGSVEETVYSVVGNVIEILAAPKQTKESLQKLSQILRGAAHEEESPEVIASKINEEVPELSVISKYIPKNATELVAWLTFTLLAIQTIYLLGEDEQPDINIIFNQAVEQSMEPKNYYPFKPQKPPSRNSLCPCESGKRYKQCCGKTI